MKKALWTVVHAHFERLDLVKRYNELGNDEIAEILCDCRTYLKSGLPSARPFLIDVAQDRRAIYGRNHWLVVLMESMAQHPDFDQWTDL